MYFLLLADSRAQLPQQGKVIIAKHGDKQILEDFYKNLIDGDKFKADSVLAPFIPPAADDQMVIVEWTAQGWTDAMVKEGQAYIDHGQKLISNAIVEGKKKYDSIDAETFTPEALIAAHAQQLSPVEDQPVQEPVAEEQLVAEPALEEAVAPA